MGGMQVGMIIGGIGGLVYVLVNGAALGAPAGPVVQGIGVAAFVGLLVALYLNGTSGSSGPPPQFSRGYWIVVLLEVVAIFGGSQVMNALGLPPLPWVTIVVGLHFVPLGRMWQAPTLLWAGVVIATCGAAGLVAAVAGASAPVVALLAGVLPGAFMLAGVLYGATRRPAAAPAVS